MRHFFRAKSPKTGEYRKYEGLLELGTTGPYAIVTADQGADEKYGPEEEGFRELLEDFKRVYPDV